MCFDLAGSSKYSHLRRCCIEHHAAALTDMRKITDEWMKAESQEEPEKFHANVLTTVDKMGERLAWQSFVRLPEGMLWTTIMAIGLWLLYGFHRTKSMH
jgi:hypothetical protein